MDIEEFDKAKKASKEQSVLDSLPKTMRVPNKYMPGFWACLITGITACTHILIILMQVWNVRFNLLLNYKAASLSEDDKPTTACVYPADGKPMLVDVVHKENLGFTFEYHRRQYVFSPVESQWQKTRCRTTMATELFERWEGFTDAQHLAAAKLRFGSNEFNVRQPSEYPEHPVSLSPSSPPPPLPPCSSCVRGSHRAVAAFTDLYKKQLVSPLCVFQLFSVLLWTLDEYWQYSLFTLFMILTFEGTVVFQRIKSLGALKGMGNKIHDVFVYRYGEWMTTVTTDLLPGDIVSLAISKDKNDGTAIVPADLIVLNGSAVLSEASLTGESVPQMKEKITDTTDEPLAIKGKHKSHILYAGTTMLQCKGDKSNSSSGIPPAPNNGLICFTLRTGFTSSQGKLVRMIEGSQEKVKGHEIETAILLSILFVFACLSSGYVLKKGMEDGQRSRYALLPLPPPSPLSRLSPPLSAPAAARVWPLTLPLPPALQVRAPPPLHSHCHVRDPAGAAHADRARREQLPHDADEDAGFLHRAVPRSHGRHGGLVFVRQDGDAHHGRACRPRCRAPLRRHRHRSRAHDQGRRRRRARSRGLQLAHLH